jgi:hypothetical protein
MKRRLHSHTGVFVLVGDAGGDRGATLVTMTEARSNHKTKAAKLRLAVLLRCLNKRCNATPAPATFMTFSFIVVCCTT